MAVDLSSHKDELLNAWKDVVEDKTSTNWALFGYEKQSYVLTVIEKGDGGLEELMDELNSAKIMYAFCRVTDPNTSLTKFVLVNWQGEGAPLSKKGGCANHLHDVTNFFKGAHVTINARNEDDVEPSAVMEKVAKSTGSKFNFQDRSEPVENLTPIGSVYKRIQPAKEINAKEREKFWMKEQEEEKKRLAAENVKRDAERLKMERECRDREMQEAVKRDEKVKERNQSISETREAEHNAENTARNVKFEKLQWEKQMKDDRKEVEERATRSDTLRRERSQEAQALISKRTFNARAIFEQNTSAGQMSGMSNSQQVYQQEVGGESVQIVPEPPIQAPSPPRQEEERIQRSELTFTLRSSSQQQEQEDDQNDMNDVPSPAPPERRPLPGESESTENSSRSYQSQFSYTRDLLREGLPPRQQSEVEVEQEEEEQNWDEPTLEAPPNVRDPLSEMLLAEHGMTPPTSSHQSPQIISATPPTNLQNGDEGLKARALYDYQAADETEISFDPDDLITHVEQIDEGWWQGLGPDGTYGLFPANYVEIVD